MGDQRVNFSGVDIGVPALKFWDLKASVDKEFSAS